MTKLPSIKQMANRANSGHYAALLATRDKRRAVGPNAYMSEIRGMMTCLSTLRAWGCIDGDELTDRGRELLRVLDETRKPWGAA
ncbi:MAG TPA: hypothetical protein VFH56_09275 [Acidimicrobiales bacterium]|nr:hypothetical protein [Acidimicrobiales bacterium]